MRFHSAPVIRLADAKPVHLGHVVKADGRFRIFAFAGKGDTGAAGRPASSAVRFSRTCAGSPVVRYTPAGEDIDAVIDLRAVFQQSHDELAIGAMPPLLLPRKGRYGLQDYEKMFCADPKSGNDIFAMRGIDRDRGCLVIVRPDQFVAHVLPLDGIRGTRRRISTVSCYGDEVSQYRKLNTFSCHSKNRQKESKYSLVQVDSGHHWRTVLPDNPPFAMFIDCSD